MTLKSPLASFGRNLPLKEYYLAADLVWNTHPEIRAKVRRTTKDLGKSGLSAVETLAESGKTIVLLWVIHCIAIAKEEKRRAELLGKKVDLKEFEELVMEAAEHTVNNFEIYTSMLGASAAGSGVALGKAGVTALQNMTQAQEVLGQSLKASPARAAFKTLLRSGGMSLITFMGWEAGANLWYEAVREVGIPDTEDPAAIAEAQKYYHVAQHLDMTKFLWSTIHRKATTPEEKKAFALVTQSMFNILMKDPQKRWMWFYNTWRKRIATGDFVSLVVAMSVAGVVGAKVGAVVGAPFGGIPGTIVAGFFGFTIAAVGGALTIFIPQPFKDRITEMIRDRRLLIHDNKMRENMATSQHYIELFSRDGWKSRILRKLQFRDLSEIFDERSRSRNGAINVWTERLSLAMVSKQYAEYENSLFAMSLDPEMMKKLDELLEIQNSEAVPGQSLQDFLVTHETELNSILADLDQDP
ncbi:MAG: hypothetical protein KDD22_05825, partial [Bdellovibrionales bacterium]|nr:hypothetical protein [Bdellovibrionales bacterium]